MFPLIKIAPICYLDFQDDLTVKHPPAMQEPQETWVQSQGQEDPLEEGTATHSSVLAWRFPWAEEPGGLQSVGRSRTWLERGNTAQRIQ